MLSQPNELTSSADIRVVWRDDVDPRGTAPLWASVQFVATDPRQARPTTPEQVVIEIGGPPRRVAAHRAEPRKGRLM